MPTRILREGIITSKSVNDLSDGAEKFYRRVMSICDDYGRYYSHAGLLRAACYPRQLDRVSDEHVTGFLAECVAVGLIFTYGEGEYIQIVKFNQQCRSKSKFPEPTENELLNICVANANHLQAGSYKPRLGSTTTPSTTPTPTPTPTPNANPKVQKIAFGQVEFPESLKTPKFQQTWELWVKHLTEKRSKTTPSAFKIQIARCVEWGEQQAVAAILYSIEHNWQGIFEEKQTGSFSKISNRKNYDENI
jgi:hypothetical protein